MQLTKEIDGFLSEKRARKEANRQRREWKAKRIQLARRQENDNAFGRQSTIIKMLAESFAGPVTEHRGYLRLSIPEIFSVIEYPEMAIAVIGQFAKTVYRNRARSIRLNHTDLREYDLAANGLLDIVAVELRKEDAVRRRKTSWSGDYPSDPDIRRFIQALGIVKHLHIEREYPAEHVAAALRVFDVRNRHYYRALRPNLADFKSKTVAEFSDHINRCLADHGRQLTTESRHKLCAYTGEILDNAHEHAGMLDWTIQGYLDNSRTTPLCEIAIFNFGKTIAETLRTLPKDSYTWTQIQPYLKTHKRKRFFGTSWEESDLLTLIALQGHVSSKNKSPSDTRGNGTVDLIEFFQKVHVECSADAPILPKMAILSGHTHILFDGTYKLAANDSGIKIIAFNAPNDLHEAPDRRFVRGLNGSYFPGTIISIRFPLADESTTEATPQANE